MSVNFVEIATEIEKMLADIATIVKAIPPPSDQPTKAALDRVNGTLATLIDPDKTA